MADTDTKLAGKYADQPALEKGWRELRTSMELDVPAADSPLVGENGRFRSVKELEASYTELSGLQRRIPSKKKDPAAPAPDPKADENPEAKTEQSSLAIIPEEPGSSGEITEDQLITMDKVLGKAGLKSEDMVKQWIEKGELSADQYKAMGRQGWSKAIVNDFMAGQQARVQLRQMQEQVAIEKAEARVGGKDQLAAIKAWAGIRGSVAPDTLAALNAQLNKNAAFYPDYIEQLGLLYEKANGKSSQIIEGGGGAGGGGKPKTMREFREITNRAMRGDSTAAKIALSMTQDEITQLR